MRQVQLHGLLLQDHVTADAGQVAPSLGCTSLHIAIQTTLMFDNMIAQVAAEQYSGHSRHKIDTFAACRMYDVLLFPMTSDVYNKTVPLTVVKSQEIWKHLPPSLICDANTPCQLSAGVVSVMNPR